MYSENDFLTILKHLRDNPDLTDINQYAVTRYNQEIINANLVLQRQKETLENKIEIANAYQIAALYGNMSLKSIILE